MFKRDVRGVSFLFGIRNYSASKKFLSYVVFYPSFRSRLFCVYVYGCTQLTSRLFVLQIKIVFVFCILSLYCDDYRSFCVGLLCDFESENTCFLL